ncbi:transmembrane protein 79-like [Mizuhopecten yessoensis]|uniref:Transmembrane protein 79 n=1 Tax=Mizuhopecten yessoensis TaxID=6573 RepID=A0A210QYS6_MIZYE|nr:transmembrane protein 79-like [Mizuhopecten yessoensis]OWF53821.1 Transmembrane protein 79 [Mizuhopecten yessoensis]
MVFEGLSPRLLSVLRFRLALTVTAFSAYIIGGYYLFPFSLPVMTSVTDRLIFTLRWQLLGGLTLLMGIQGVGKMRAKSEAASDPIKGNGEHLVSVQNKILRNTLEQFVFHFIGQLALCTYLSPEAMKTIPVLVTLFVIARIIFQIIYPIDAMKRIFGFMSTFLPTVGVYVYCLYCFLTQ